MRIRSNQNGFGALELFVIAIFVTLVAFVGYRVVNSKKSSTVTTTTSNTVTQIAVPKKISTKTDANIASKALDQTPIDTQLDPNQLDSSIKSLL